MLAPETAPAHGTRYFYNRGCRCDPCQDANKKYQRVWAHKRGRAEPAIPTSAVLHYVDCLIHFGLERENIAKAAGVSSRTIRSTHKTMWRGTAQKIESLHWGLYSRHYPFRQHCKCTRDLAVLESFEEAAS